MVQNSIHTKYEEGILVEETTNTGKSMKVYHIRATESLAQPEQSKSINFHGKCSQKEDLGQSRKYLKILCTMLSLLIPFFLHVLNNSNSIFSVRSPRSNFPEVDLGKFIYFPVLSKVTLAYFHNYPHYRIVPLLLRHHTVLEQFMSPPLLSLTVSSLNTNVMVNPLCKSTFWCCVLSISGAHYTRNQQVRH